MGDCVRDISSIRYYNRLAIKNQVDVFGSVKSAEAQFPFKKGIEPL